jgi:predicted ATP-dependent endonuclease of OLD family
MPINYKLSKVMVDCFRGIDHFELELRDGFPSVLIGSNNAGKSTVLNAIALALNGGSYSQKLVTA